MGKLNMRAEIMIIAMMACVGAGVIVGYLVGMNYGPVAEYCQLQYVAEEEIMELEQQRVKNATKQKHQGEQELFFGNADLAVELTGKLAKARNNGRTKVIFSISPIFTEGVKSISTEIYQEVINQLKNSKLGVVNNE